MWLENSTTRDGSLAMSTIWRKNSRRATGSRLATGSSSTSSDGR
jgi:hypothetical protein